MFSCIKTHLILKMDNLRIVTDTIFILYIRKLAPAVGKYFAKIMQLTEDRKQNANCTTSHSVFFYWFK